MSRELQPHDIDELIRLIQLRESSRLLSHRKSAPIEALLMELGLNTSSPIYFAVSRYVILHSKYLISIENKIASIQKELVHFEANMVHAINNCLMPNSIYQLLDEYNDQRNLLQTANEEYQIVYSEKLAQIFTSLDDIIPEVSQRNLFAEVVSKHKFDAVEMNEGFAHRAKQLLHAGKACEAVDEYTRYISEANYIHFKSIYAKHLDPLLIQEKILEDARDELIRARKRLNQQISSRPGLLARIRILLNKHLDRASLASRRGADYVKAAKVFQDARAKHLDHYRRYIHEVQEDHRMHDAFIQIDGLIRRLDELSVSPYSIAIDKEQGYYKQLMIRRHRLREFIDSFDELYHQAAPTQFTHQSIEALKPFDSEAIVVWQDDGSTVALNNSLRHEIQSVQMPQQQLLEEAREAEKDVLELASAVQQSVDSGKGTMNIDISKEILALQRHELDDIHPDDGTRH